MNNATLGAVEKLTISRERLRAALATSSTSDASTRSDAASSGLFDALKTILPGGNMLWDEVGPSLRHWWEQHPLHTSGELAGDVIQAWGRPLVQRHPVAAVATALALGATLVWARPWRWTFRHPVLSARPVPAHPWFGVRAGTNLAGHRPVEDDTRPCPTSSVPSRRTTGAI